MGGNGLFWKKVRLQEEIFEEIDQEMQDEDPDLSEATAVINRIRAM